MIIILISNNNLMNEINIVELSDAEMLEEVKSQPKFKEEVKKRTYKNLDFISFDYRKFIKDYFVVVIIILSIIFYFSLESNEEKIARIIDEYNNERSDLINSNSWMIKINNDRILELQNQNSKLELCNKQLRSENNSIIKPTCSPNTKIINEVWADFEWDNKLSFKWRVNSKWESKSYDELCWNVSANKCNFSLVADIHNIPVEPFIKWEKKYKVYKEFALCIARADSWLWKYLKSKNNIWNVGNNDRWQIVEYKTIDDWIEAIYKVLNNSFLGHKQSIWSLSPWWWGNSPFYATSPENWNINVLNCLNTIVNSSINENSKFRL